MGFAAARFLSLVSLGCDTHKLAKSLNKVTLVKEPAIHGHPCNGFTGEQHLFGQVDPLIQDIGMGGQLKRLLETSQNRILTDPA